MDLAAVREGLADAARDVGDVDTYPSVPGTIAPPAVCVGRMQIDYNQTMGGLLVAAVTVHAFASLAADIAGQDVLLPMLAPDGLKAALEADRTLRGVCEELRVESAEGPGISEVGGVQFWAASWTVRVWG